MKALAIALLALLLVGCAARTVTVSPTPSGQLPTPTELPATLSTDQLAPSPPLAVQDSLRPMTFIPLTPEQLADVTVTVSTAERIALAGPGPGYGPGDSKVVWKKVGCVFLGWYVHEQMPSDGYVAPSFPAYLVQVLGDPVKGFPMLNIDILVINAYTGERAGGYGAGAAPAGIMGTTCGVTP